MSDFSDILRRMAAQREAILLREQRGQAQGKFEPPPSDAKERIIRFVNAYDGGDCFFVESVTIAEGKATLEGYGTSVARIQAAEWFRGFDRHTSGDAGAMRGG